jgi:hypothetical protein
MTDQSPWNRFKERNEVHILGEFRNDCGEQYVIYRMENGDKPYFTGDEVDWKPREPLFGTAFVFAKEERDQIARILWPTMQEQIDRATAQLEAMTPEQLAALDTRKVTGSIPVPSTTMTA